MDRVLKVGDDATGTTVLHDLYREMADHPMTVDLDALWKRLGVEYPHGHVTFRNDAPLAGIRDSMTSAATK
jgi:hypothetical protein